MNIKQLTNLFENELLTNVEFVQSCQKLYNIEPNDIFSILGSNSSVKEQKEAILKLAEQAEEKHYPEPILLEVTQANRFIRKALELYENSDPKFLYEPSGEKTHAAEHIYQTLKDKLYISTSILNGRLNHSPKEFMTSWANSFNTEQSQLLTEAAGKSFFDVFIDNSILKRNIQKNEVIELLAQSFPKKAEIRKAQPLLNDYQRELQYSFSIKDIVKPSFRQKDLVSAKEYKGLYHNNYVPSMWVLKTANGAAFTTRKLELTGDSELKLDLKNAIIVPATQNQVENIEASMFDLRDPQLANKQIFAAAICGTEAYHTQQITAPAQDKELLAIIAGREVGVTPPNEAPSIRLFEEWKSNFSMAKANAELGTPIKKDKQNKPSISL